MHAPRRSEHSHQLTPEERSRGGRMRAARIYTAKAEAMAEGRPYKPARRKKRRLSFGLRGDPYAPPDFGELVPTPEPEEAQLPDCFGELTDEEVAAAARVWWLDDLCERRDAEHDEGVGSFVLYE
jgi:hypothetical protein